MLSDVWAHRGWAERGSALKYDRLARLARTGGHAKFAPLLAAAASDERRHADLCDQLCEKLGGRTIQQPPTQGALAWLEREGDELLLLEVVLMCCLGETFNAALLQHELDAATDPVVRGVVHQLLIDEVTHARIGWAMLEAARSTGDLTWLEAPIVTALADVRTRTEGAAMSGLGPEREELLDATLRCVIVPGFVERGIRVAPL